MRPHFNFSLGFLLIFGCFIACNNSIKPNPEVQETIEEVADPILRYGFNIDSVQFINGIIKKNQFLADILSPREISLQNIALLSENAEEVFDVRNLRYGRNYSLVFENDTTSSPSYFIYEPNRLTYVVYELKNSFSVVQVDRKVEIKMGELSGIIEDNLWNSMANKGMKWDLITLMEDAFAWSVDFHHIQKGDSYKLIYEEKFIRDESVAIGNLIGAYFRNYDNEYFAVFYEGDKYQGFFDPAGRPMKRAFLKSPVKYSRISSSYSRSRLHPILKTRRPHLGTDYAAPYGTEIRSVANGVIVKMGYTRGNGNYIKIKHDDVYQTQYLHMQRFAKGMKTGLHIKQNQIIGRVGSTGLATGPHVCFRFWKNGRQVNHLRENLPPPEPMSEEELPKYLLVRDNVIQNLNTIEIPIIPESKTPIKKMVNTEEAVAD